MSKLFQNIFTKYFIAICAIILLHYIFVLRPLEIGLKFILAPVQKPFFSLAQNINSNILARQENKILFEENESLKDKISSLENSVVNLKIFIEENENLASQNEYLKDNNFDFVNARIISKNLTNSNLITLDKGSHDGLKQNMAVIGSHKKVIGKIVKVDVFSSEMLLLIDSGSTLSSSIAGKSDMIGLIEGEYNVSLKLTHVLKSAEISSNDFLITSGQDENIPVGLVIGQVDQVIDSQNEIFKSATLTRTANFKNINWVSVVVK